jgi:hypothetical protein
LYKYNTANHLAFTRYLRNLNTQLVTTIGAGMQKSLRRSGIGHRVGSNPDRAHPSNLSDTD